MSIAKIPSSLRYNLEQSITYQSQLSSRDLKYLEIIRGSSRTSKESAISSMRADDVTGVFIRAERTRVAKPASSLPPFYPPFLSFLPPLRHLLFENVYFREKFKVHL